MTSKHKTVPTCPLRTSSFKPLQYQWKATPRRQRASIYFISSAQDSSITPRNRSRVPLPLAFGLWVTGSRLVAGFLVLIPQLRLQSNITRVTKLYEVKNYYLFDFVLARGFFYHKIVEKCGLMSPLIHSWSKIYSFQHWMPVGDSNNQISYDSTTRVVFELNC